MEQFIKKIYEVNSLCCPTCGGEMKVVSFITDHQVIWQILNHLYLWSQKPSRASADTEPSLKNDEWVYELFYDLPAINAQAGDWSGYNEFPFWVIW